MLREASESLRAHAHQPTDGRWLEDVFEAVAPHVREWNLDGCWKWSDWPDRDLVMPAGSASTDVGIDLVGRRRDDGRWVAVQAKSRRLDEFGSGKPATADEIDSFVAAAGNSDVWAERWLAVNGDVSLAGNAPAKVAMSGSEVKVVNVAGDVEAALTDAVAGSDRDDCPHCHDRGHGHDSDGTRQSRSCMQREAVDAVVRVLRSQEQCDEDGIPRGEARGRLVLPCGSGKTRIALRAVEALTYAGEVSVVLCPSIALVAQLRREFLSHASVSMRTMAVCSDESVGADEEEVVNADDVTLDRGLATTEVIKGCPVSTDVAEIAAWVAARRDGAAAGQVSVLFGTYQSADRTAEAIAEASAAEGFKVLVCDEAHRTAGVRAVKRGAAAEERLRAFTLCHDRERFPATYRLYQTATPRIWGERTAGAAKAAGKTGKGFVVRDMDDQTTFGVELYRRSYADAVRNGWLSDYRIVAMAVGGPQATDIANELVREADEQAAREAAEAAELDAAAGRKPKPKKAAGKTARLPSTGDYLKGMAFALAMGGAARTPDGGRLPLRSCIGFLNTIARSETMASVLQSDAVRKWVAGQAGEPAPVYRLEHLDASTSAAGRDEAKRRLGDADDRCPHGVLNVGIFGEGTDAPSLSAVAFLEPRKSPIDVVQAVGRAMRRAEGKHMGYIVVPVVIPPGVDAERHLATSDKHEGWRELGDILQALRAHDKRIEDSLPEMLTVQVPSESQLDSMCRTAVAVGRPAKTRLEYAVVTGSRDTAEDIAREAVAVDRPLLDYEQTEPFDDDLWNSPDDEPTALIVHAERPDGSQVTREDSVPRHKPKHGKDRGPVNTTQTRRRAVRMAAGEHGRELPDRAERDTRRAAREAARQEAFEGHVQGVLLDLSETLGDTISMNLLEKSGLTANTVQRDLNLLEDAVNEAARYLHDEAGLAAELDTHFGLDTLGAPKPGKPRADGATIAALLWMNAAMLHQRVHTGGWLGLKDIEPLTDIRTSPEPEEAFRDSWNAITRQDFLPVLEPAIRALRTARRTGRLGGLRRALRHLAGEAEQIAETYADMGTDHAGALFNKVMGDQASDGAYFTRPVAAGIAARLALDAVAPHDDTDWADPDVWRAHKTVDLACGSGTLLAAVMAEMKRRAKMCGADNSRLAELQKVAVEEVVKGFDINPVSLQLAATQLMSGNTDVKYRKMGLHLMPYGPQPDGGAAAGTLELLARNEIVAAGRLFDDAAESSTIETSAEGSLEGPEMDDAAAAAVDARIVVMNPPFTSRIKTGEKFNNDEQRTLRSRMDALERMLADAEPSLDGVIGKKSIGPMFEILAGYCLLKNGDGVIAMCAPTVIATMPSAEGLRKWLSAHFHVHTILTCHQPGNINLSQDTNINESVFVFCHSSVAAPDTRIVGLDRLPRNADETIALFDGVNAVRRGTARLPGGWGAVSRWPVERVRAGDWSAAVWRQGIVAAAATDFASQMKGGGGVAAKQTQVMLSDRCIYRKASQ